jgi:hypothetical protein
MTYEGNYFYSNFAISVLHHISLGDQVKENEMGGECSMFVT